jgi:alpha-glucosidase (family GH31 glycosyl hydrolase)
MRLSEADILGLMKQFEENLYKKHGVALDSFTIDMGWSDPHGVWDIDRKLFPDAFARIQAGC